VISLVNNIKYSSIADYLSDLDGSVQVITGRKGVGKTVALLTICEEMVRAAYCKKILIISSDKRSSFLDSFLNRDIDIDKVGVGDYRSKIGFIQHNSVKCKMSDYVNIEYCNINDSPDGTYTSYANELMEILDVAERHYDSIFILENLPLFYGHKNVSNKIMKALKRFKKAASLYQVDLFIRIPLSSKNFSFDSSIFMIADYVSSIFWAKIIIGRTIFDKFLIDMFSCNSKDGYIIINTKIFIRNNVPVSFEEQGVNKEYAVFVFPYIKLL